MFFNTLLTLILYVPVLMSVAFVTIAERKVMGSMQRRLGPNKVGVWGLLQPFADAIKLMVKENLVLTQANWALFMIGPAISLLTALLLWALVPFTPGGALQDSNLGIIIYVAISSLGVYGTLIAGWAANSKFSYLGAVRSTAQMLSYELILSSILLIILALVGSFDFTDILNASSNCWLIIPIIPLSVAFLIASVAESNRPPFDLVEAESELTGGFQTEHSALPFVLFFLAEYANLVFLSTLFSLLLLGGGSLPFSFPFSDFGLTHGVILGLKTSLLVFVFIWVRASFPRIRFDHLIYTSWTGLLPPVFASIILVLCGIYAFDITPF